MKTEPLDAEAGPHRLYYLAMVLPYVMAASLIALLIYCEVYHEPFNVSAEDGLLESATCAAFGLIFLLSLAAIFLRGSQFSRPQRVVLIVFALIALVAVGEELSWGQRIFGFAPPESMTSHSGSTVRCGHNDVTWHNLTFDFGFMKFSIGGALFGVPMLICLFLHGVFLPLRLMRGSEKAKRFVDRIGLFVPPLHLGILVLVVATFLKYVKTSNTPRSEYRELIVPTVYACMLIHCFFKTRKPRNVAVTAAFLAVFLGGLAGSAYLGVK